MHQQHHQFHQRWRTQCGGKAAGQQGNRAAECVRGSTCMYAAACQHADQLRRWSLSTSSVFLSFVRHYRAAKRGRLMTDGTLSLQPSKASQHITMDINHVFKQAREQAGSTIFPVATF
jgi:hypothetical protein